MGAIEKRITDKLICLKAVCAPQRNLLPLPSFSGPPLSGPVWWIFSIGFVWRVGTQRYRFAAGCACARQDHSFGRD
jgi:hypothetical protein